MNDMTFGEIKNIKKEIDGFMEILSEQFKEREITENEKSFFRKVSKQIIFFKVIVAGGINNHFINTIISDLYYYILSILQGNIRYAYLNERSIIENYLRLITRQKEKEGIVNLELFEELKKIEYPFTFSEDDFSFLKSEYATSCSYIHGSELLKDALSTNFMECLSPKINKQKNILSNVNTLLTIFSKIYISTNYDIVDGCFHRRKSLLEYLLGTDCKEILMKITR